MSGPDDGYVRSTALMGTAVTIEVIGHGTTTAERRRRARAVDRAFGWFRDVEARCSRFDPDSEVRHLTTRAGQPVPVSPTLFQAARFALALAQDTGGAFDPTVGRQMEDRGHDIEYRSGRAVHTQLDAPADASWRDVSLDDANQTITLHRPLVLDMGAVAKGLAVDLAARELREELEDFAIDAGGDLYLGGLSSRGAAWLVGIRHPRQTSALIQTLRASNAAVCTSGNYAWRRPNHHGEAVRNPDDHHIIDPRTRRSATLSASATVVADLAMVADALSTAAFVLGPADGISLLERHGVDGLVVSPSLELYATTRWSDYCDPMAGAG